MTLRISKDLFNPEKENVRSKNIQENHTVTTKKEVNRAGLRIYQISNINQRYKTGKKGLCKQHMLLQMIKKTIKTRNTPMT